jgi:hypothetical protein
MRKWFAVLLVLSGMGCGDSTDYIEPTGDPDPQLSVSGEWPLVTEGFLLYPSFRVAHSEANLKCLNVPCSSFDGYIESDDGEFVVPPNPYLSCVIQPLGLFVAGWVEFLPGCYTECRADPYPYRLECTSDEQFAVFGAALQGCAAPAALETVPLDITIELPTELLEVAGDRIYWTLNYDLSACDKVDAGGLEFGGLDGVSSFRITTEVGCAIDEAVQDDLMIGATKICVKAAKATVSCTSAPQTVSEDSWQVYGFSCPGS